MSATFRAAASLFALIGFYVLALGMIAGIIIGGVILVGSSTAIAVKVIAVAAVPAIIVVVKLLEAATSRPQPKPGLDVTPEDTPELWALVTELSDVVGTRGPEQIRLVSEVNAAVSEDSRFLGLIGGARRMYLGVPLLQGLSVIQLRAVLAHEFGHYSSAHTRLGPIAYRGRQAVIDTVQELQGGDVSWVLRPYVWVLRFYAGLYILVSMAMSRSQEREADRLMVQVAGRANAQAALRELPVIGAYWSAYMEHFVGLGWGSDLAPTADGFFGGFERLLAARADERDTVRADVVPAEPVEPEEKSTKDYARELLDSHPPIAKRISAMDALPDRTVPLPDDNRSASALIPAFATAAAATAEKAYVFGYRQRLDWDDLIARAAVMNDQLTANTIYRAAARLAKEPRATLGTVVALSEAGRAAELVRAVASDGSVEANELFESLVRAAGVHAGAAHWRMSWSDPVELVTADGEIFDAKSVAALLAEANTAPDAVARLTALGVDVTATGPVSATATADVGKIVGGIADMTADEATYDVLVLDNGLILADKPHETEDGGSARLNRLVLSGSLAEIAARHRFVPYESIASAKVRGWFTVKATIRLHDGTRLRLKERMSSNRLNDESDKVFKDYLARRPAGDAT